SCGYENGAMQEPAKLAPYLYRTLLTDRAFLPLCIFITNEGDHPTHANPVFDMSLCCFAIGRVFIRAKYRNGTTCSGAASHAPDPWSRAHRHPHSPGFYFFRHGEPTLRRCAKKGQGSPHSARHR